MNKSPKPEWRKTSIPGLYEYRPGELSQSDSGVYYSRFSLNRKRTFRSHKTSVFEQAKIKHWALMGSVEKDRQSGFDTKGASDFKTLGALLEETKRRLARTSKKLATMNSRDDMTSRLKHHWRGNFETF